jgi:predicted permease
MAFDSLRQDLRYGLRQLQRAPLFTAVASLSVAIGVIVAVGAFSLVNVILLKPLPVPQADRVYHLYTSDYDGRTEPYGSSSYPDYEDFARSGTFRGVAASTWSAAAVSAGNDLLTEQSVGFVSGNYFDVLGLRLTRGTSFQGSEPLQIVITHPYWQREFGGDAGVIGRTLNVNSFPLTIVGVAPESFRGIAFGPPVIGWAPASLLPMVRRDADALTHRGARQFAVIGRLHDGVRAENAAQRLNALATALAAVEPDTWLDRNGETRLVSLLTHQESRLPRGGLLFIVGMGGLLVAFVVLLACTNVAALLLGRAADRDREVALRLTLGATRGRLIRQLLTESVLLAGIGGTLSYLGLLWTLSLVRQVPVADIFDLSADWRVLFAAMAISLLCALIFGLAPGYQSLRVDLRGRLAGTATVQRNRMRGALIALQVAISSVLILLALSAVRGVRTYVSSDPGVELDGLVAMRIDTHWFGNDSVLKDAYTAHIRELLATAPGIQTAASTVLIPLGDSNTGAVLELPDGARHEVEINTVGRDFFATVGVSSLRGRTFDGTDRRGISPVAVVNPAFLRRFGDDMLGRHVKVSDIAGIQIVGMVPEIHYHDPRRPARPLIYLLDEQIPWGSSQRQFLFRVEPGTEQAVGAELRQRLRQRFPDLVSPTIESMREHMARQTLPHRIAGRVALAIGGIELGLASVGLYGLLLYALLARRREIGVRLALGATPREASWAVLRDGLKYAAFGTAAGMMLAVPASLIAQQALPGASRGDPAPFLISMSAVLGAAAFTAWLPARRAGRVQPAAALRQD